MTISYTAIRFTVSDQAGMEREINAAVDALLTDGLHQRKGILVTRHTYDSFSVELHNSVPSGLTYESWE